jgi:hypothetical protein
MSNFLQKLKLGTNNVKMIDWPGTDTKVTLRILSQQQLQEALFDSERLFKVSKIETNLMTAQAYQEEESTQILYRSLRDPINLDEPIAPNITEFRKALTVNEKKILIDEYRSFDAECNPSPDNLSEEDFDRLVADLKKKPEETVSNILSLSIAKRLLLITASAPMRLPKVNS